MLNGYVLYDRAVNSDSINMATSIAGVTNAIIVDPATLTYATAAHLPLIADTRNMTYSQVYSQYASQFNKNMLFHQDTTKNNALRDYSIMNHGFMFYTDPTDLAAYASSQNHQGRIYGWGPNEYDLFSQASQNNQQVAASNWSWSSSTTSKWQVPLAKQPYHAPFNVAAESGKHYVAFVMSDGDNVQSLTGGWATDPRWFGSPYRGDFDMTWDLTSTLGEMNPVAFNYYYQHASNGEHMDSFVSAHGAGTSFPSQYPDNAGLVDSISASMEAADQRVISILDSSYDTSTLYPILDDPQVMGMMFKTYLDDYKGRDGALEFHNGKPILSVKYSLWDGGDTALSIANALNDSTHRDALNDPASFSIVNVNPWSTLGPTGSGSGDPMSNLDQLVEWLDPNKVEVVTLEELMVLLRNNFGAPVPEPSGLALLAVGLPLLLGLNLRRIVASRAIGIRQDRKSP
jgi:GxGYxYP putative glycoside hydrolase C-terminal domain/GxGYxYP_N second domain/GxGYxYP third domain